MSTLSLAQLTAAVTQLQDDVTALQNTATDSISPNYVAIAADGTTGADFSGKIQAAGVTLEALSLDSDDPNPAQSVMWTSDGTPSGALVGQLYTGVAGDGTTPELVIGVQNNTFPGVTAITMNSEPDATSISAEVNGFKADILGDSGGSSFLQGLKNLSDVQNAATARNNLSVPRFWPAATASIPSLASFAQVPVTFSNPSWDIGGSDAHFAPIVFYTSQWITWEFTAYTTTSVTVTVGNVGEGPSDPFTLYVAVLTAGY